MSQLIFFLAIAAVLFLFLIALARRGRPDGAGRVLAGARRAVFTLETELLPDRVVKRLFARVDLDYVASLGIPEALAVFRSERKRVAILWIDRVRGQILQLRALHLGSARFYARLDLKTELLLAWDFASLLIKCHALRWAFAVAGPNVAPRLVGEVAETATRICLISRQSLAFLGPNMNNWGGASGGPPELGA